MTWSRNNLILALTFVLLAGGAYYYETVIVYEQKREIWLSRKLVDFEVKDVKEFTLERDSGEKFRGRRISEEKWELLTPLKAPGDAEMIDDTLDAVRKAEIDRILMENAQEKDLSTYGFDQPKFKIDLNVSGEKHTVLIGNQTPTEKFYYARVKGDPRILIVPISIGYGLKKDFYTLRDKTIISLNVKDVEKLELKYAKGGLVLEREGDVGWKLKKPLEKILDRYEVEAFIRRLDYMQSKKFLDAVEQDQAGWEKEYGFDNPQVVIRVYTGDKRELKEVVVGKKEPDGRLFYVRRPGKKTIYEIDPDTFNGLIKKPFDFEKKFIFSMDRDRIKRIQIEKPGGTVVLKREGDTDNWTIIRPEVTKAAPKTVDKFLGMMTAKVIEGYEDKVDDEIAGFDKPKAIIALTLDGEKEPRMLTIGKAKNRNLGFAKTKDKKFLIKLETAAIFLGDLKAKPSQE